MPDFHSQPEPSSPEPPPSQRGKIVKGVLICVAAIALLAALVPIAALVLFWSAASKEEELRVVASPGDRYHLHVNYTPAWVYSPHDIILRVKQGRKTLATYSTPLANDGANLSEYNAQVQWDSETVAHICLKGEEQSPAGIRLNLEPIPGSRGDAEGIFTADQDSCL